MDAEDRRWIWLLVLLLAAVAGVRLLAADNELWLDEIWTLEQIRPLRSALGVFTDLGEENHALYTLWAYAFGPGIPAWVYRAPAILSGLLAVLLAARIGLQQSGARIGATFAVVLVGFSYLDVHFGSEARGYAPSTALALLALVILLHAVDRPRWRWRVLFAAVLGLAFVAQPMAVILLPAAAAWIVRHRTRHATGLRRALVETVAWLAAPTAFFVAYFALYLRHLQTGGGPEHTLFEISGNAFAYTFGLPTALGSLWLNALGALVLLLGLATLIRERNDLWLFYLVGCIVAPVALIWLRGSTRIYERYFVLSAVLALLMTSHLLTRSWQRAPKLVSMVTIAAFLTGSGVHTATLLRYGRGDASGVIRRLAAATSSPEIRYSANHPFRVRMLIDYHAPRAAPGRRLRYVGPVDAPDWVIKSLLEPEDRIDRTVTSPDGEIFDLAFVVPTAPMSGFWFAVYRRRD